MLTKEFLELLLRYEVLRFGEFVTKSGRHSPYFFNTGRFCTGPAISRLGDLYAQAIFDTYGAEVDNIYGPAYKGIPLCVAVSEKLSVLTRREISFTFNRKEQKAHGEKGLLVGHEYQGGERVVIVEDVLTAGTSLRESLNMLSKYNIKLLGGMVGVDRQEKGVGAVSARQELVTDYKLSITSLITLQDIISYLQNNTVLGQRWLDDAALRSRITTYMQTYCAL